MRFILQIYRLLYDLGQRLVHVDSPVFTLDVAVRPVILGIGQRLISNRQLSLVCLGADPTTRKEA